MQFKTFMQVYYKKNARMPKSNKRRGKKGMKKTVKGGGNIVKDIFTDGGEQIIGEEMDARDSEEWIKSDQKTGSMAKGVLNQNAKPVALGLFGVAVIVVGSLILGGVIKPH